MINVNSSLKKVISLSKYCVLLIRPGYYFFFATRSILFEGGVYFVETLHTDINDGWIRYDTVTTVRHCQ